MWKEAKNNHSTLIQMAYSENLIHMEAYTTMAGDLKLTKMLDYYRNFSFL